MSFRNVIFDLDGTLVDSKTGILNSLQYTIQEFGFEVDWDQDLNWIIGPPMERSMAVLLAGYPEEEVRKAIDLFRSRYDECVLDETQLYPSVPDVLTRLASAGKTLFVATSKPHKTANRLVVHLEIAPFFKGVYGRKLDGSAFTKQKLFTDILARERIATSETIVVGDRKHDIEAAQAHGLKSAGVTYGYGGREELLAAGADIICDELDHIPALI